MRIEELAGLVEEATGADGSHPTAVGPLALYRLSETTRPHASVHEPALCIVAQGSKRVMLGDEAFAYDPANYLLVSTDLPITAKVIEAEPAAPYLGVRISLDLAVIGELIAASGPFEDDEAPGRALAVSPMDPHLLDAVGRLVGLLKTPWDVPFVAPLILREIHYRLLVGDQGGRLRQIAAEGGRSRRIASAIERLRANFDRPFRIEDVARAAHMSVSTLHHHFKAVTAMSPLQFQKQLRLQEARRLLLAGGLDAAAAGYRVGYESPSQFSREYRRAFGEPPRRDRERLRGTPSAVEA